MPAGYSGTPLAKKLGVKAGFRLLLWQQPEHYLELFSDWPEGVEIQYQTEAADVDCIHAFFKEMTDLQNAIPALKAALKKTGMLWVSWPKGKSTIPTDLKREPIREHLLDIGLVDVKVAAVDEDWSGLKFVYRLKDR
ncbi:MAG: DUF3052 domain-containing protein [Bacteroidota bacterium]